MQLWEGEKQMHEQGRPEMKVSTSAQSGVSYLRASAGYLWDSMEHSHKEGGSRTANSIPTGMVNEHEEASERARGSSWEASRCWWGGKGAG